MYGCVRVLGTFGTPVWASPPHLNRPTRFFSGADMINAAESGPKNNARNPHYRRQQQPAQLLHKAQG
ncbi:unnamed protein product [Schistocephalus solidus]|uniref:Secreted protein n=1 Tax=Schistocephalus solidus TaxID=70667 RepID=A0A183TBQ7_SCHSO|nr:unnamed protein product [Schistocephalus solidus]